MALDCTARDQNDPLWGSFSPRMSEYWWERLGLNTGVILPDAAWNRAGQLKGA